MDDRDIFSALDIEGLTPVGQVPAGPYGQLVRSGQAAPEESFLQTLREMDIDALQPVAPRAAEPSVSGRVSEIAQAPVARSLTPKFIGERLAQRVLPSEVEPDETAELRRALERKAAEIRLGGESPSNQALAAASGLSSGMMGIPAAGGALAIKGLGALGVPGYERQAGMPFRQLYEDIKEQGKAAETLYPKTALAGTAAGIGTSMATMPAILPRAGAMTSGALTGATYGTAGGALETGDPVEALKMGAISGLFGAVAGPVLERTIAGFDRLQREGRALVAGGQLSPEAIRLARQAGMSPEDIRAITPYMAQTQRTYGTTPEALRAAQGQEFGIPLTRGMISQDPATLAREAKYGTPSYTAIGEAAEGAPQVVQAAAARGAGAPPMVGAGGPRDLQTAITDAASVAQNLAQQGRQAYEAQYARAGAAGGIIDPKSLNNFGTQIADRIVARGGKSIDGKDIDLTASPVAAEALKWMDETIGQMVAPTKGGVPSMNVSLAGLEQKRRALQGYYDRAQGAEKRAVVALTKEFDDLVAQKLNSAAYSGDPRAIREWEAARQMFSGWQQKFGIKRTGDDAGALVRDIVDQKRSPDQVGQLMFNFNNTNDPKLLQAATKTYMNLARAVGPNSPEMMSIRQAYIEKLMQPMAGKTGELTPKDFGKVADDINRLLNGRGRPFSSRVFTADERAALQRYQRVMRLASEQRPDQVPGVIQRSVGSLANMGVNAVTIGVGSALGLNHPVLAGGLAVAIAGLKEGSKLLPYVQSRAANIKPGSAAETLVYPSQYPASRVGTAAGLQALPDTLENVERAGRKHGGRISAETQADRLVRAADSAKNQIGNGTKQILNAPDEHVVKALKVANENLEG